MIRVKELLAIILLLPFMACDPNGLENGDSTLQPEGISSAGSKYVDYGRQATNYQYVQSIYLFNETIAHSQKGLCEKEPDTIEELELCNALSEITEVTGEQAIIVRPRPRHCPVIGEEKNLFDDKRGIRVPGTICETRICTSPFDGCVEPKQGFVFVINAVSPDHVNATLESEGEIIAGIGEGYDGSVRFDEEHSKAYLDFGRPSSELIEEGMNLNVYTVVEIEGEYVETSISIVL